MAPKLRNDLNNRCLDPEFASLLNKSFSPKSLVARLELVEQHVRAVLGSFGRCAKLPAGHAWWQGPVEVEVEQPAAGRAVKLCGTLCGSVGV